MLDVMETEEPFELSIMSFMDCGEAHDSVPIGYGGIN